MHWRRPTVLFTVLIFAATSLTYAASAQVKATAPEKMMPRDKAVKMRECERRAAQQKIKMEDRTRYVNECIAA
jgi:hypothetical protein